MNKNKYLLKNIGILTISNFSSKLLVFFLVPVYTSVLSTKDFGIYDIVVSSVQLLFPILTLNISDAVMRFSIDRDYDKDKVASVGISYLLLSVLVSFVSVVLLAYSNFFPIASGVEIYVFLYYIGFSFNQFLIQLAKGREEIYAVGLSGLIGTVSMVGSLLVFLFAFNLGLKEFFLSNILGLSVPSIYLFWKLKLFSNIQMSFKVCTLTKTMLLYSTPLLFTMLGWWLNSTFSRFVVTSFISVSANGVLAIAYKIPTIISTIQGVFIQAWQVSAIKAFDDDDRNKFYDDTFDTYNLILCSICCALIFFTIPIAKILYSNEFFIAWELVPFLLISSLFNGAGGFLGPVLSAEKKTKPMAVSALHGAIVNVVMCFVLISFIGLQGATIASLFSSFAIFYYRKKSVRYTWNYKHNNRLYFSWLLLVIQACIEVYFHVYHLIELLCMLAVFIIYREKLYRIYFLIKKKI